jgi:hypothetical protein
MIKSMLLSVIIHHHLLVFIPKYANDTIMNGGYTSDLIDFIMERPQIKLWTHGHTHDPFDYMIGSTRVVCNPRGYSGYENRADYFELKYFNI